MAWKSKCDDPTCPGWAVFNENEIQRCDACDRFANDREALEHVLATAEVSAGFDVKCDGIRLVACEYKGNAWIISKVDANRFEYPVVLLRSDRGEFPDHDVEDLLTLAEYEEAK